MSPVDQWDQRVRPGVRQAGPPKAGGLALTPGPAAPQAPRLIQYGSIRQWQAPGQHPGSTYTSA